MMYTISMHRTQILLKDSQYQALKTLGRRSDKGLSELVREAVDKMLYEAKPASKPRRSLKDICGIARGGGGDIGRDHDEILYPKSGRIP